MESAVLFVTMGQKCIGFHYSEAEAAEGLVCWARISQQKKGKVLGKTTRDSITT